MFTGAKPVGLQHIDKRAWVKKALLLAALVAIGAAAFAVFWSRAEEVTYDPPFDPKSFGHPINNRYFTLKPGTTFHYAKRTMWGTMRVETQITGETKLVMGVTATVVRDREWVDDELVEDTRDWYAQDKEGNVWYFGETVDNYEDGKLSDHGGSWEAGIDGARPGIIMPKEPKAGQTYRQEYYKGRAEDMGSIKATRKKVTVPQGTYDDCVQIRDWSRLESGGDYKYFCSGIGFLVLTEEWFEKLELVSVSTK